MKVKLIQPRMLKRPMDTDLKIRMSPHLGLLTVANIIRHDCEVTIENENIRPIDFDDVPDLVGIAVTVDVLPRAIEIASIYRQKVLRLLLVVYILQLHLVLYQRMHLIAYVSVLQKIHGLKL